MRKTSATMRIALKLCIVVSLAIVLMGAAAKEPSAIIQETADKIVRILDDPDYQNAEKQPVLREEIRKTMLAVVDMELISNLTLATQRKNFSKDEFKQFVEVFSKLLFNTYISHLETHAHEKLIVVETKQLSERKVVVVTQTADGDKPIPIEFSLVIKGEDWKLYDIKVEGVSLVKNYRSQFREILMNDTPAQLLKRLEEKGIDLKPIDQAKQTPATAEDEDAIAP